MVKGGGQRHCASGHIRSKKRIFPSKSVVEKTELEDEDGEGMSFHRDLSSREETASGKQNRERQTRGLMGAQGTDSSFTLKGHCEKGDGGIGQGQGLGRGTAEVIEGELKRCEAPVRGFVCGDGTLLFCRGWLEHRDWDRFLGASCYARRTKADQSGKRMK